MQRPSQNVVTLNFGKQPNYPLNGGFHKGTDFSYSPDNKVYMPETGQLQCVAWDGKTNEGNVIYVTVGNRRHALCHLSQFLVGNGTISQGTVIGVMGDSGFAQGKHLHWALIINGVLVDPLTQLEDIAMNTKERVIAVFQAYLFKTATEQDIAYWVGRPCTELDDSAASSRFAQDARTIADLQKQVAAKYVPVTDQLFRKAA